MGDTMTLRVMRPDGSRHTCEVELVSSSFDVAPNMEAGLAVHHEPTDGVSYTIGYKRLTPWRSAGGRRR